MSLVIALAARLQLELSFISNKQQYKNNYGKQRLFH